MNTVESLQAQPFLKLLPQEQNEVKRLGREMPPLRSKFLGRKFNVQWYTLFTWLAGCLKTEKAYCFPCLLFNSKVKDNVWATNGVCDWKHFVAKAQRHEKSSCHLDNCVKLAFFGQVDIAQQFSESARNAVRKHNAEVDNNRYILAKIIDCIKFCGAFELALRGHDERDSSGNQGVFRGLVNFASSLDSALKEHLEHATVFKGTSKTIQNELLDIMFSCMQDQIKKEIRSSDFLAIVADDTTDISSELQNVVVLRYLVGNNVVERFWSFASIERGTAQTIAERIFACLSDILPEKEDKNKLIAQCYDGAAVMSGGIHGVQTLVKEQYPSAHYVHCYAHQFNLILQQALHSISSLRIFFASLQGFSTFFSHSSKRVQVLDKCVGRRIPRPSQTRWNFTSRIVQTVCNNILPLQDCFNEIKQTWAVDMSAVREATGLLHLLEDGEFLCFLKFFGKVMPHVDILFSQLQKRDIDSVFVKKAVSTFTAIIQEERDSLDSTTPEDTGRAKRRRTDTVQCRRVLKEACDVILSQCLSRFEFTGHLLAAKLIDSSFFYQYATTFPTNALQVATTAYPMLDSSKLRSELTVLYSRPEFRETHGAISLLQMITYHNLESAFSEIVKLIKILITTPMSSSEAERTFSTLKRVKTFLRNTMSEDRLNALAMLSIEKKMVRENLMFNQEVIERFANLKDRRAKFLYRK